MKKVQSLFVILTLLFASAPVALAEENDPNVASERKCANFNAREKVRCLYNNRRTRRNDLRRNSQALKNRATEDLQQRKERWNKSRAALRRDCRGVAAQRKEGFTARRTALNRCLKDLKASQEEKKGNATENLRSIRRSERNKIKDQGSTRRTFRKNADNQLADRKRNFNKRKMIKFNKDLYKPEIDVSDEQSDTDKESSEE